jgi:putative sterol carrier protein
MKQNVWFTSTRSGNNGQCCEVRDRGEAVDVRDSKHPEEAILTFSPEAWAAFIAGAKDGEFDL